MYLRNESYWVSYFDGEFQPFSVAIDGIEVQYERDTQIRMIDDMNTKPSWNTSSSNGYVKLNGITTQGTAIISQGNLRVLDSDILSEIRSVGTSPHFTNGIRIYWKANDELSFELVNTDISSFGYVSFRIANCLRGLDLIDMEVSVKENGSAPVFEKIKTIKRPDIRTDMFDSLYVYAPFNVIGDPTKTNMQTIRVPLLVFQSQGVNLNNVSELIIKFPPSGNGKVNLSTIAITD